MLVWTPIKILIDMALILLELTLSHISNSREKNKCYVLTSCHKHEDKFVFVVRARTISLRQRLESNDGAGDINITATSTVPIIWPILG